LIFRLIFFILAYAWLAGCTTGTRIETSQLDQVHDAYLESDGTLVVCMTGTITGETGRFSLHLPINSTLLRPENAVKYFDPFIYSHGDAILPKFAISPSLIQRGCAVGPDAVTRTPVPVVRDRFLPDPSVPGGVGTPQFDRNKFLAARKRAATAYLGSLEQRVGNGATVYEAGYANGRHRPEILFSSPDPIYGPYRTVSFGLPERRVKKKKIISPVKIAMLPATAAVGLGMGVAIVAQNHDIKKHSKRKPVDASVQPKKEEPEKAMPPFDWHRAKIQLDNRLTGSWQSADKIIRCDNRRRCFSLAGYVCFLQVAGNRLEKQCSFKSGFLKKESLRYTRIGKNSFRFQVTASSLEPKLVGTTGLAEYRVENNSVHIRSQFDDADAYIVSEASTYSRK